ncbi:bacteriohemerythrin [Pseudodesulfovibrio indicus]|jgi:hemerythrin|uniref:Hemerythrin n=1 Tax=Pseudodesulfovibrio indicus TaxID=1716143 RepID=A0A126QMS1_9BACT|nr:bacteriohemerythrin [Pseudodesulfovibrio indicus]AMK11383.1 hemerythrin [Pseudodesulfovibrio indicus]TDT89771.1 hemerythrin [Pseudodesulfovibrio indicus]
MPLMQWDETMSVGLDELDEQHMELIALINEAFEAIQRSDESRLMELVDHMREYAEVHFETEESVMRSCGFPELDAHREMHGQFAEKAEDFRRTMRSRTNLTEIFIFLSRWLTNHIMVEDRKLLPYLPPRNDEGA